MIAGVQLYNILSAQLGTNQTDQTQYTNSNDFTYTKLPRVYPIIIKETDDNTPPYILYQTISSQPEITNDGITGHEWVRMQIDVYHEDAYQATLLANKVINAINDQIQHSIYGGQQQMYDAASDLYRQSIDYEFSQTTPTT